MFDIKVGDRVRLVGSGYKDYFPNIARESVEKGLLVTREPFLEGDFQRVWVFCSEARKEVSFAVIPGWEIEPFEKREGEFETTRLHFEVAEETTQVENPKHMVESPDHYTRSKDALGLEVWDILDFFFPDDPHLWNVGKYLFRAGHKDDFVQDLEKLKQYVDRRIEKYDVTGS